MSVLGCIFPLERFLPGCVPARSCICHSHSPTPTPGRDLGPGMPTPEKGPGTRHIHPTPKDLGSGTPLTDTYLWKQYLPTTSFAGGNNINETDWLVWADITEIHCNSWIEKPLIVKNKVNCTHGHMDWYVLVAKKPPALCLSLFSLEANS